MAYEPNLGSANQATQRRGGIRFWIFAKFRQSLYDETIRRIKAHNLPSRVTAQSHWSDAAPDAELAVGLIYGVENHYQWSLGGISICIQSCVSRTTCKIIY